MRKDDPIRGVGVEGLGLRGARKARRGVAHMPHTHAAPQVDHVFGAEDIPDQAAVFAQMELLVFTGNDAGRILSAVLQDQQGVVQGLVDRPLADDSDYAAHEAPRTPARIERKCRPRPTKPQRRKVFLSV